MYIWTHTTTYNINCALRGSSASCSQVLDQIPPKILLTLTTPQILIVCGHTLRTSVRRVFRDAPKQDWVQVKLSFQVGFKLKHLTN